MDKETLLGVHRNIYTYMKKKALSFEEGHSIELKQYQNDQKKLGKIPFSKSKFEELLTSCLQSNIIYIGDFHTFDQNVKNFERVLKQIIKSTKTVSIGVEFIHADKQEYIGHYLNGLISEIELLEAIDYQENWMFPWSHYRKFFSLAKEMNLKILALNSKGGLIERDQFAANIIENAFHKNPENIYLIFIGELHILKHKLPKFVKEKLGKDLTQTIIHQNIDDIYWPLHSQTDLSIGEEAIVKFSEHEFSIQSGPPWIKYESAIYWYENIANDPDFLIHEYIMEKGARPFNSDIPETFYSICQSINKMLQLNIKESELEDFNLYDHQALAKILDGLNEFNHQQMIQFLKEMIKKGQLFKIPFSNKYYCSNYSMNRLSFIAGLHIFHILIARSNPDYESIIIERDLEKKAILFIYQSLIAYFVSKLVNPYRKCDMFQDLVGLSQNNKLSKLKRGRALTAIELMEALIVPDNKTLRPILKGKNFREIFLSSRYIGNLLGEILFNEFYQSSSPKYQKIIRPILEFKIDYQTLSNIFNLILANFDIRKSKKRIF